MGFVGGFGKRKGNIIHLWQWKVLSEKEWCVILLESYGIEILSYLKKNNQYLREVLLCQNLQGVLLVYWECF